MEGRSVPKTSTDLQADAAQAWDPARGPGPSGPSVGAAAGDPVVGAFGGAAGGSPDASDLDAPMVSRVQLDEALSQVADVVLTVATDGTVGYVSPAVRDLLGFDQAALIGHNLLEFLGPEDGEDLLAQLARGHGHHEVGDRVAVRHAHDEWRDVLVFVSNGPALDAVGYRSVVLRDAKDRGHTLDALRQRLAFEDLLTR